jgi:hypothetical protein
MKTPADKPTPAKPKIAEELDPVLVPLVFDLKKYDPSKFFYSEDDRATMAMLAGVLRINRHYIPKTGYRVVFIRGGAGSGRTTATRQVLSSIRGVVYFEFGKDVFTEVVVAALESYLAQSVKPVAITISGLDEVFLGVQVPPEEAENRELLRRLNLAIEKSPAATLILDWSGARGLDFGKDSTTGLPAVFQVMTAPYPDPESVKPLLAASFLAGLKTPEPLDYEALAIWICELDATWFGITNVLAAIEPELRTNKREPSTALLAHYFKEGVGQKFGRIKPEILYRTAIHEAAYALLVLVLGGPRMAKVAYMAQAQTPLLGYGFKTVLPGLVASRTGVDAHRDINLEIIYAAGRICEETLLGDSNVGASQDLSKMRASILGRITDAIAKVTDHIGLLPLELDAWLPGQITSLSAQIEAETFRTARDVIAVNRAGIERFAKILARERFLSGEALADAFRAADFVNPYGCKVGPDQPWTAPDFAVYHLDPTEILGAAYAKETERRFTQRIGKVRQSSASS